MWKRPLTVTRKKLAYSDSSITTANKRKVVPKRELYEVLFLAHTRTAHHGRQITSKWIYGNYSEVNVKMIAMISILFLLCKTWLTYSTKEAWRRGGLVVSALDFRSRGRWFEPGHCCRVVSLDKKLYSTLSLFTQVYKWVPAIIMLAGNLAMD